ncbi:hypothetical protein [Clostridium grantii]|uniref:Uncharacterized protein n=1 Tax=Clostridium grantii DSM 8605 TaxID=1121316 RepID=A0A1M5X1V9_9CLOT|nr:hypothetical protein [Clostridium grantii]SHH93592.1 hypothetical protein SAMN02745207_03274 [Clostridium grantii DSM 8605]
MKGISDIEFFDDESIKCCTLNKKNEIDTSYGKLVPQYDESAERHKFINSISFYNNGNIKSIALQNQISIKTLSGVFKAEYLTFYEDGSLKKIFPLNGKLSGYWTEENEYSLAENMDIQLSIGKYTFKLININFYPSNAVKSITLWPKESVLIETPLGKINTRIGVSFYENGKIASIEPSDPVTVETKIGKLKAYDSIALGIHGENNSLKFSENRQVLALTTISNRIEIEDKYGNNKSYEPSYRQSMCSDNEKEIVPLKIEFTNYSVIFNSNSDDEFNLDECKFNITQLEVDYSKIRIGCTGCSGCSH